MANDTKSQTGRVPVIDAGYEVIELLPGALPRGIALSPDGTRAFVCNFGLNSVSVIDTAARTIIANIPVGANPYYAAFDAVRNRCYVTCLNSSPVFVIDTIENIVAKEIETDRSLRQVTVDPTNRRVYVICPYIFHLGDAQVVVIDADEELIIATIGIESGQLEAPIAVDPIKHRAYLPISYARETAIVGVIDTKTNKLIRLNPYIGGEPAATVLSPDGSLLYVSGTGRSSNTSVVDTNTDSLRFIFATGLDIHLSPKGDRAYYLYSHFLKGEFWSALQTVDTATGVIVSHTLVARDSASKMAVSSDGKYAYITQYGGGDHRSRIVVANILDV